MSIPVLVQINVSQTRQQKFLDNHRSAKTDDVFDIPTPISKPLSPTPTTQPLSLTPTSQPRPIRQMRSPRRVVRRSQRQALSQRDNHDLIADNSLPQPCWQLDDIFGRKRPTTTPRAGLQSRELFYNPESCSTTPRAVLQPWVSSTNPTQKLWDPPFLNLNILFRQHFIHSWHDP